mmetsp:Transcript_2038/g.4906  ORF Transcript_2038/g.4906 Transcript_2038/m.4906 type:complete len:497 (-) Transcript_2038:110-1600(-)
MLPMTSTVPLCKCICGNPRKGDPLDPQLDPLSEGDVAPPASLGLTSYYERADQPMRGVPIREGRLWLLSTEEEVEPINLSLYINGIAFAHRGREISVSFSPFGLVRNCKFQTTGQGCTELASFKCFKVSLFTQGICFYFGVQGNCETDSENERSLWVLDVSRAMRLVTQSLFPVHGISCNPVKSSSSTYRRLMAGYLIHYDGGSIASVMYCELHPQRSSSTAKLVFYEDELCQVQLDEIVITERSCCCEKVGINCSCFSIEEHQFSSRTLSERRLWLRAISNLKVKLQNRAPSPTDEELGHYRIAIQEHVKSEWANQNQTPMDALLQQCCDKKASTSFPQLESRDGMSFATTKTYAATDHPAPLQSHREVGGNVAAQNNARDAFPEAVQASSKTPCILARSPATVPCVADATPQPADASLTSEEVSGYWPVESTQDGGDSHNGDDTGAKACSSPTARERNGEDTDLATTPAGSQMTVGEQNGIERVFARVTHTLAI